MSSDQETQTTRGHSDNHNAANASQLPPPAGQQIPAVLVPPAPGMHDVDEIFSRFARNDRPLVLKAIGKTVPDNRKMMEVFRKLKLTPTKQRRANELAGVLIAKITDPAISNDNKRILKERIERLLVDWGVPLGTAAKARDHKAMATIIAAAIVTFE